MARLRYVFSAFYAFVARDAISATSYRLSFAMRFVSLVLALVPIYFFSRLIGDHPSVAQYGGYLPFVIVGMVGTRMTQTGFMAFSTAIRHEQVIGTLEALFMTPARASLVIFGSSLWAFAWGLLESAITVGFASLIFGFQLNLSLLPALAVLALMTAAVCCVGILSAAFIMVFKQGDPFRFVVLTLSFLLGGALFPVSEFPGWLQKVSALLPLTHGLKGMRENLLAGGGWAAVMPQIGILTLFVVVLLPLSFAAFQTGLRMTRRDGSLVHY